MVAELFGKVTGCTRGKGGSMHLIDTDCGVMGTSAVVGTTIANAAGYAYALKLRQSSAVVACFFGDGASEEGVFAETLNFAVLKHLPLLFVCENNGYAIHTNQSRRQGVPDICARARAYGVPAEKLDGNDVIALREKAGIAIAKMRAGEGPQFIEAATYRWREHVGPGSDYHLGFREKSECEPWEKSDPVRVLAERLTPAVRSSIESEVEREVANAFDYAEQSPFPDPWELMTDIFKEESNASAACLS
jgi:TPP-dependent pyruvate/acetoin dehydrogenase alpha subunit